jgi:ADP-ribose pyrophosphatase
MARRIVHVGRKIQVAVDESPGLDGAVVRRDVVIHPGAAAVLPLVDEGHVVLVRNRRCAVGEVLWEIPAGTLEPGEPVEETAMRELAEETGYRAGSLVKVGEFFPSPGVLSERTHLYEARGLVAGEPALEPGEEMTTHVVPLGQALAWAMDGTIRDAKTLIALMWLRLGACGPTAGPT